MAWAFVQGAVSASQTPATATMTKSFASNVTAGNRLFVWTDSQGASGQVPGNPTDSQGNTYTQLVGTTYNGTAGTFRLYSAVAGTTGACTVSLGIGTISLSGSELGFTIEEFSGLNTSAGTGCLDKSSTGTGTTSPSIPCGTTAATTAANQLALAGVGDWGNTSTYTAPAGFALDATACKQADATIGIAVASKTSASGATETGSFGWSSTVNPTTTSAGALIAVIKLASAASLAPPIRQAGRSGITQQYRSRRVWYGPGRGMGG